MCTYSMASTNSIKQENGEHEKEEQKASYITADMIKCQSTVESLKSYLGDGPIFCQRDFLTHA